MISSEDARLVAHIAFAPSGMAGDLETVEAVESQLAAGPGRRDAHAARRLRSASGRLVSEPDRGQPPPDGHHSDRHPASIC